MRRTYEVETGVVIATAKLFAVTHDDVDGWGPNRWAMPGQWHWHLSAPRPVMAPIPVRGRQGFWRLEEPIHGARYAITLWPEWLPTILYLDKRVENRTWYPPEHLLGRRIALHAGRSIGGGSLRRGRAWLADAALAAGWRVDLEEVAGAVLFHAERSR